MLPSEGILSTFVEVADTLVVDFDLVDLLYTLAHRAATISGAEAAGILLVDDRGTLQYMAATNEEAAFLEMFQEQREEGPCFDAYVSGEAVVNMDLGRARGRWPTFVPRALAQGFHAVHALPLRLRSRRIGALNLFAGTEGRLDPFGVRVVQALADVATIAILHERVPPRADGACPADQRRRLRGYSPGGQ